MGIREQKTEGREPQRSPYEALRNTAWLQVANNKNMQKQGGMGILV